MHSNAVLTQASAGAQVRLSVFHEQTGTLTVNVVLQYADALLVQSHHPGQVGGL